MSYSDHADFFANVWLWWFTPHVRSLCFVEIHFATGTEDVHISRTVPIEPAL